MPIKSQYLKFLKPISFKKLILFFSAAFLFNVYFEKTVIAENQAVVSSLIENISLFKEIKPLISLKKDSQPNLDKKSRPYPLSKNIKKARKVKKNSGKKHNN